MRFYENVLKALRLMLWVKNPCVKFFCRHYRIIMCSRNIGAFTALDIMGKTFSRHWKVCVNDTPWRSDDSTSVRQLGPDLVNECVVFSSFCLWFRLSVCLCFRLSVCVSQPRQPRMAQVYYLCNKLFIVRQINQGKNEFSIYSAASFCVRWHSCAISCWPV